MEKYNYYRAVAEDIEYWMDKDGDPFDISQFSNRAEAADWLYDELWAEDSITGNGPYGYADEFLSEEYLCHNLDLLMQACDEFQVDYETLRAQYKLNNLIQYLDCTIRCYVLMNAIYDALEKWESYGYKYGDESVNE